MSDQLDAYIAQQSKLLQRYNGRIIVMHDNQYQADFSEYLDAVNFVRHQGYKDGDYLIVRCTEGDSEYTGYFANIGLAYA